MTYEQVQHLKPEAFKRLCGVRRETFTEMVNVLEAKAQKKRQPGRASKLSIANQLLIRLQYWHYHRTYVQMAIGVGCGGVNRLPDAPVRGRYPDSIRTI